MRTGQLAVRTDEGDAFSIPSSSQESNGSSATGVSSMAGSHQHAAPSYTRKRSYEPSEDDDTGPSSPSDQPQVNQTMNHPRLPPSIRSGPAARHALPTSADRRRRRFLSSADAQQIFSAMTQDHMDLSSDFEDPPFLRSREEVDSDYAVDLGDNPEYAMYDA